MSATLPSAGGRTIPLRVVLAVSPKAFIMLWWLAQLFHMLCAMHAIGVAKLHRYFIYQELQVTIDYLGNNVFGFFNAVIVGYLILASLHLLAILRTAWWSLKYREWRFTDKATLLQQRHQARRNALVKQTMVRSAGSVAAVVADVSISSLRSPQPTKSTRLGPIKWIRDVSERIVGRFGFFGVEGTHYENAFFALEVIEIALQVYQAYKLSCLVSRIWINRLYAVVLVFNCWSTIFVHTCLHSNRLVKRVVLLVVDSLFDVVSSMVIPYVVFYPYYRDFNLVRRDFPLSLYYHDTWIVQAISENRQVFVTSWLDYVSKLTPGFTIFGATVVLKSYTIMDKTKLKHSFSVANVRRTIHIPHGFDSSSRVRSSFFVAVGSMMPTVHTRVETSRALGSAPHATTITLNSGDQDDGENDRLSESERSLARAILFAREKSRWQHATLFLCGLAVLIVHIHATTLNTNTLEKQGCLLQVWPWFSSARTCIALEINCYLGQHSHGADTLSVESTIHDLRLGAIKSLIFASCAKLHMPPLLQSFSSLQLIKVYNSTIEQWNASAELNQRYHRDLQLLYISDSNFSTARLPVGLLGDEFPSRLVDIEFSGTNLIGIPDDASDKWGRIQYFVLERSPGITEVPTALSQMKIPQLHLGSNRIASIPDGIFAGQTFWALMLDGNPITKLPDQIGSIKNLMNVSFAFTHVFEFPDWVTHVHVDPANGNEVVPFLGVSKLEAGGTPICATEASGGNQTLQMQQYFVLKCTPDARTYIYPISSEREWRRQSLRLFA